MRQIQERKKRKEEKKKKAVEAAPTQPPRGEVLSHKSNSTSETFTSGDTVRIKGLTTVGKVESIDGKMATVIFGDMRTKMRMERLEPAKAPTKKEEPLSAAKVSRTTRETIDNRKLNFKQDLDVRGMRGEEAINAVTYFIDDAILVGMSRVRILHGTGTGALRHIIREYLATIPNVTNYKDEHVQFGGSGITVVDIG
jgi:DNA mismatch repair protein MutS2